MKLTFFFAATAMLMASTTAYAGDPFKGWTSAGGNETLLVKSQVTHKLAAEGALAAETGKAVHRANKTSEVKGAQSMVVVSGDNNTVNATQTTTNSGAVTGTTNW